MKFSLLIANYNNGNFFGDCFQSIINQSYSNWEVIIVDDGSEDCSVKQIKSLIYGDDRFQFYENDKNYGCGYTKNRCASLATGQIMGYLDPDDALLPTALELMVNAHSTYVNASLIHSSLYYCDENLNIMSTYKNAKEVVVDKYFTNLDNAVTAFASFKTKSYLMTEGINEELYRAVDQDLYLKLSETGSFYFINTPMYKYRLHKDGIASNNGGKAFYAHLKVLMNAEKRRAVNLEGLVSTYISNSSLLHKESQLNNLSFLLYKFKEVLLNKIKSVLIRK